MNSFHKDPKLMAEDIRFYWGIEHKLHWQLDVSFREDAGKKRKNAAQNFSAIYKMALRLIKNDPKRIGIVSERKIAG